MCSANERHKGTIEIVPLYYIFQGGFTILLRCPIVGEKIERLDLTFIMK